MSTVKRAKLIEVLELVRDLSSTSWVEPDGKIMQTRDNQGRPLYFISEAVMQEVRAALGEGDRL